MRFVSTRFVKFLWVASVGLSSAAAMAQTPVAQLKDISSATLISANRLSQSRLPVHKNISCWQVYQGGRHVFTDCSDSQGFNQLSKTIDRGWNQAKPSCAISIQEPQARVESNVGMFKMLFGNMMESDIKLNGGQTLQLSGDSIAVNPDSIELEAKSADGKTVRIKCFAPNATNADLDYELSGVVRFRSIQIKAPAVEPTPETSPAPIPTTHAEEPVTSVSANSEDQASGAPVEKAVEASMSSSDAESTGTQSAELPTGSDAHPADGTAPQPAVDSTDVQSLEQNAVR
jgi:hypothetical protein